MKPVRCAIYTRKSSDEGLDQAFNSLDAQREACAAYILSQTSEGWTALPEIYDDGGLSGGTLDRPALQRLLAEVAAGAVDIIVVYKVDRLTRSLLDFSKLVETFDKAGTSFVSVTQSFNTTTSMGRLTLNMLLSFAQFEREVTAERIRDKIAASKAKGMWMGGTPPIGYKANGRSLEVVELDASVVRQIFEFYVELGNVRAIAERLQRDGVRTPVRTMAKTGRTFGGQPYSRGQLYVILKNPLYVGLIEHHGKTYPALHEPIVDRELFDRVQARLSDNMQGHRTGKRAERPSLLAGKIVDAVGKPLVATHACKGTARYRYYVSRALHHGEAAGGLRIPATEIENAVRSRIEAMIADPVGLATAPWLAMTAAELSALAAKSGVAIDSRALVRDVVQQVRILDDHVEITCSTAALAAELKLQRASNAPDTIELIADVRLTRSGRVMRLVQDGGRAVNPMVNGSLVGLIVKAQRWWSLLREGKLDIATLAAHEGVQAPYVTRVLRLAFLSPAVVEAIFAGRQSTRATVTELTLGTGVASAWSVQKRALLAE